jgi:hypothetical protein
MLFFHTYCETEKITALQDVTPCCLVVDTNMLKKPTAFMINNFLA